MNFSTGLNHDTLKVLIIDDEADICYLLSTLLKQKNSGFNNEFELWQLFQV